MNWIYFIHFQRTATTQAEKSNTWFDNFIFFIIALYNKNIIITVIVVIIIIIIILLYIHIIMLLFVDSRYNLPQIPWQETAFKARKFKESKE